MTTLIVEPNDYSPKAIAVYKKLGRVYFWPRLKGNKKSFVMKLSDILVVRLGYQIDRRWIDKMPNLKIIASNTTGLNHIDVDYAEKRGIKIISLRGKTGFLKNITATAELALGLVVALIRKIPWAFDDVKAGRWNRDAFKGDQLRGKTLGVLGYGRLGKRVARYGKALGMKVIAHDPYVSGAKASLGRLFKESDVLSIHVLLNEESKNLVKLKHFKTMKPTAYVVNTARGEIIEEGALFKALTKKYIAGAAIDVMRDERADGSHLKKDRLWGYAKKNNNLIIVPHIGGVAREAWQATEEFVAELVFGHTNEFYAS